MRPKRVGEHHELPVEHVADLMQHHHALLLRRLGRDEAHARPGDRFGDRLGIRHVVLLPLYVRLYILGGHQLDLVTKLRELSRPEVRGSAGLHPD
jgi:hypothetical protein